MDIGDATDRDACMTTGQVATATHTAPGAGAFDRVEAR